MKLVALLQEEIRERSIQTAWESVVSCIHDSIVHDRLPKSWAGAEWWVQVAMQTSKISLKRKYIDKRSNLL